MLAWLRRFPVRLGILLVALAVFPPALLFLNSLQSLERLSRADANESLQISSGAAEMRVLGIFEALRTAGRGTATEIGGLHASATALPELARGLLDRRVSARAFEIGLFLDLEEKLIASHGTIPNVDLLNTLRPELKGVSDNELSDGILAVGRLTLFYVVVPMLNTQTRGWLVVGNLFEQSDIQGLGESVDGPLSILRYRAGDSWAWSVVASSWQDPARIASLNAAGAGRTDGTTFTAAWDGRERIHHPRRLSLDARRTPYGVLVERPAISETARDTLAELQEISLLGIALALTLAAIGGMLLNRNLAASVDAAAAAVRDALAGSPRTLLEAERGDALGELNAAANELTSRIASGEPLGGHGASELEVRIYELERKAYELGIENRVYKATNFQAGLFEVLSQAAEVLMVDFGVGNAFLYRKSPESSALSLVFVKRRLKHSGQIVTSKEATSLLADFAEDSLRAVENEARNAIASGRLHRCEIPRTGAPPFHAAALPVTFAEGVNGALCLVPEEGEYLFTEGDSPLLEELAAQISDILGVARLNDTSVIDSLTRLYNYRHFQNQIAIETMRARRSSSILTLLAVEIDDYKQFTAKNELKVAEEVTKEIASLLRTLCRSTDFIARKEGGLFLLLLPETTPEGAAVVTEKIRLGVEALVTTCERGPVRVTVSIGVAFFPTQALIPKDLQNLAMEALQSAQDLGGNRAAVLKTESTNTTKIQA